MSKTEAVLAWFAGLAALVAILALLYFTLGQLYLTAVNNGNKVQHLVDSCISQGYDGFVEDSSTDGRYGYRCYNEGEQ